MSRATQLVKSDVSFDDYLNFEQKSLTKHELVHGQLFAMAGASDKHNRLSGRLYAQLLTAEASPCRTYIADMKVKLPNNVSYYPDILVTCDPDDNADYFKQNPCLIIEVLSDSTEAVDRGEKLLNYHKVESLQAYVLVSQKLPYLEIYTKQENGIWHYESKEIGAQIDLPCIGLSLSVDELYLDL